MPINTEVISLVFAIIFGLSTLYLGLKQLHKIQLSSTRYYNGKLIDSTNKYLNNRLSIKFNNQEIHNLSIVIFELKNTGNQVIDKKDFIDKKPIIVEFVGCNVISCNIKETSPKILRDEISFDIDGNKLLIRPFSINFKDTVLFEVFLEGDFESYSLKARIKGLSDIQDINVYNRKFRYLLYVFLLLILSSILSLYNRFITENLSLEELLLTSGYKFQNIYLGALYFLIIILIIYLYYRIIKLTIQEDKYRGKKSKSFIRVVSKIFSS